MTSIIEILTAIIPPILILSSGWCIKCWFIVPEHKTTLAMDYLLSLVLGSSIFVVPYIILGMTIGYLNLYIWAYTVATILLLVVTIFLREKTAWRNIKSCLRRLSMAISKGNIISSTAVAAFAAHSYKVLFSCLLGPIVSGDALYFWLSMAKVFYNTNSIPFEDPYHMWTYSAEPLPSALYSIGLFLAGDTDVEAFRGIPILFFLAIPLIAYELTRQLGGSATAANASLILMCFIPIMDYLIYVYSFYADSFGIVFAMSSILLLGTSVKLQCPKMGLISGLAWSMAILSKYIFGILAGGVIIVIIVSSFGTTKISRGISTFIVSALLAFMVFVGDSVWGFLNIKNVIELLPVILLILFGVYYSEPNRTRDTKRIQSILGAAALGAMTSLIWGIRCLLKGTSLFGVPYFRLTPLPDSNQAISEVLTWVFPTSSSVNRFSLLTPIGFTFHPLMNGFFAGIVLMALFLMIRKRMEQVSIWMLGYWYFSYIVIMGYFPSGRHLFACSILLVVIMGTWLARSDEQATEQKKSSPMSVMLLWLFCATSMLQFVTVDLAFNSLELTGMLQGMIPIIPYTANFGLYSTPALVMEIGLGAILVAVTVIVFHRFVRLHPFKSIGSRGRQAQRFLFLIVIVSGLVLPVTLNAWIITSGNLLEYDMMGSWNRGDFILAETLRDTVSEEDIILTFGDVVLSYKEFRVVDLYHGGLHYRPELLDLTNVMDVHRVVWDAGIRYLVLPATTSYLFPSYSRLISYISFPEDLANSTHTVFLWELARWRVYRIIGP